MAEGKPGLGFKIMLRLAELVSQRLKETGEDVVRLGVQAYSGKGKGRGQFRGWSRAGQAAAWYDLSVRHRVRLIELGIDVECSAGAAPGEGDGSKR